MSHNLNGSDAFKLLTVFRKDDLGICISQFIQWFKEVVSSISKFEFIGRTNFSTAEAISTIEVFNYLLAEIPRFLEIFCSATLISLKSVPILFTLLATFFASTLAVAQ